MELLEKYKDDYGVITVNKRHFKLIEDMNHFEVYDNLVYNIPSSGCFKDGAFIDDTQEKADKLRENIKSGSWQIAEIPVYEDPDDDIEFELVEGNPELSKEQLFKMIKEEERQKLSDKLSNNKNPNKSIKI
mgnify:CR=1 FL=1